MSRRQPQAADLICPHLAVKHTNTLYDQIYAHNKVQVLQAKDGFLHSINQQNKWALVAIRRLIHQHQSLLPMIINNISTSLHQAHLSQVWELQMVTNIQQARFHSLYQQLRAQTKASEQWNQIHQVSDAIVQFLDTTQESSLSHWQSCTEVDPKLAEKVKRAAKRHRRKAKEATKKAVAAAMEQVHLHAPIGGCSGLQQRANMKAWHVMSDPDAVRGRDPSIQGPTSNLDLHDIDSKITKDMPWKISLAKAQINRPSTHYRKRYRPGRQGYHRSQPASPMLATLATTLCLMATLTSSVALGTSALTTAVVATGTKKTLEYLHADTCRKQKAQLPSTKPLQLIQDTICQEAKQHDEETTNRITAWTQLPEHLHVHWINAEQGLQTPRPTVPVMDSVKVEEEVATPPQLMIAQAKRARFMATCAEVILIDEGDQLVTALIDSGACLSAASLQLFKKSTHLISKEQARQLCTATGRPMSMAGELPV